ncbi:MAG: hypothetical protein VW835_05420, partial [Rickettsiales bacterium]
MADSFAASLAADFAASFAADFATAFAADLAADFAAVSAANCVASRTVLPASVFAIRLLNNLVEVNFLMGICFVFRNDAFWILAVPPNLTVPPLPPVDTDFRAPDAAFFAVSLPPLESLRA